MKKEKKPFGIFLYAVLFVVIVPLALWYWAKFTDHLIKYPALESDLTAWIFIVFGGLLLLWGMFALWKYGRGLPMNFNPPTEFVTRGPFRLVRNPIYWGFGILMIGVFVLARSSSGLWLVSPINILAMCALVLGYENIDLAQRFPGKRERTFFDFPEKNIHKPKLNNRISVLLRIFAILILSNFIILFLTSKSVPLFDLEIDFPSILKNSYILIAGNILILVVPFLLTQNELLREWNYMVIFSLTLSLFIALIFPSIGAQYLPLENFSNSELWNQILPVVTVPLFLVLVSLKVLWRQSKILFTILGIVIVFPLVTQLTVSRSAILSLLTGVVIFLLASNYISIWMLLRTVSEKIANSWKEWIFRKIRIINHGFYVGFAAFAGLLAGGVLVGKEYAWAILVFALVVIIVSALWAQIIEGSEKLKRPFGYYGGLVGMIFSSLTVWLMGFNVWVVIGVCTIFLPWAQALGRLRCLVNGCCHGSKVKNKYLGIRYYHHRSRVCGISGLKGELLHPTQLYSIIWLFFIGFVFFALWENKFPPSFLLGLYLILSGIGRFVEEAFRGEVQTIIFKGLRLYQWTAILSVVVGVVFTIIPSEKISVNPGFDWEIVIAALIGGFTTFFAMGVDFPNSNARFSRLV